jgi:hypothetical protein
MFAQGTKAPTKDTRSLGGQQYVDMESNLAVVGEHCAASTVLLLLWFRQIQSVCSRGTKSICRSVGMLSLAHHKDTDIVNDTIVHILLVQILINCMVGIVQARVPL